jgi:nucleoside-diphosphate-sugar epimerase
MRVFVTGASGFVGSAVVPELLAAGHEVVGLARSDESAAKIQAAGAGVVRGSLDDPDGLARAAAGADGVVHLAFIHDFSNYPASAAADARAIEAMGKALEGSDRPLVVTSGSLLISPGRLVTEDDPINPNSPRLSEKIALEYASRGVRAMAVRLAPSVHDAGDKGFIPAIIGIAREQGVSAYIGDGSNRWPGVHRRDAARLFRLALERGTAGAAYHGIGEEGVPAREIAETIGLRLSLPVVSKSQEEAAEHFGWMAMFFAIDGPASNAKTRERLGWNPVERGLLADIDSEAYFPA